MSEITLADMIDGQRLLTIGPDDSVRAACIAMATGNIGALPVVDGSGRLIGMLSERDVIKRSVIVYRPSATTRVQEIMTERPIYLGPGSSPREAARVMREGGFRHVPVCDGSRLVGIVSIRDFDADGKPRVTATTVDRRRRIGGRLRETLSTLRAG